MNKKVNLFFNVCLALFCLTACSNKVVVGPQGPQGEQGIPGEDGQDGQDGKDGVDGKDGQDGTSILTGNGQPSSTLGKDGDSYIDLDTWNYYIKENDSWVLKGNIKGSDGVDGQDGQDGKDGADGKDGQDGSQGAQGDKGDTGISITDTYIDENGDLIVTFSDGSIKNAGHVKDNNKYTVKFHVDDEIIATKEVLKGDTVSRPTPSETAGYTINDWYYLDGTTHESWKFFGYVITDNIDLYADFEYNLYTISFVDERFNHEVADMEVLYDHSFTLPNLEQTGYTVTQWTDEDGNPFSSGVYRISKDLTLYANWSNNTYSVSLDPNGGSVEESTVSVTYDTKYSLPIPTRTNYVFLGWFDGDVKISNSATWKYPEDKSLTAKWTNVTSTYVFDAGDGSCDVQTMVIGWEDEYSLPTPIAPEGLTFGAWYLNGTYIPMSGIWTYSNVGGTLSATYIELSNKIIVDGSVVKQRDKDISGDLIIPAAVNGVQILTVGYFGHCKLNSITIPEGVTSIQNHAFQECESLSSVIIPNSVTSIGEWAFSYCYVLSSITIPEGINTISEYTFSTCRSLISIEIPNSVTSIGAYAFFDCENLAFILIPDSVISIGEFAFCHCNSIGTLAIPDSVVSADKIINNSTIDILIIGSGIGGTFSSAFGSYIKIKNSINVSPNSTAYSSSEGCLYNKTKTILYKCVSNKEGSISIPDSVTSINSEAFKYCSLLTSINIPNSVENIGSYAFESCYSLTSIIIPISVTTIGPYIFNGCRSLEVVYCEAISKPNGLDNNWKYNIAAKTIWGYEG